METSARPASGEPRGDLTLLREWAHHFGVPLSEPQVEAFRIYRNELLEWNANRANLTAITDPHEVESRLFLESLWCASALPKVGENTRLIDVGAGGGFPGLPLVIALRSLDVTLLDSTRKKVDFLQHVITRLAVPNARAIHARAEALAHDIAHRERYDVATARALAPLPVLVELCLPFVRVGGVLIAPKGVDAEREVDEAANALEILGGVIDTIIAPDSDSPIPSDHCLVVIRKVSRTPDDYPRRPGVPSRRPL